MPSILLLDRYVVPTDPAGRKPAYPYMSYKITGPMDSAASFSLVDTTVPSETPGWETDVIVTRKEQTHFNLSVSAYSLDADEACGNAIKAANWFKFAGYDYLKAINVVVITVSNIGDRTTQIADDYERRYGFDVRCRSARGIEKRIAPIETPNMQGSLINRKGVRL
jgi:hypothetical protein